MTRYMLDTNTVSHLIRGHPIVARHLMTVPMASVCISSITEGELRFGLAKRPEAIKLHNAVHEFLLCVDVLPWNAATAQTCGTVRADMERRGRILAPLDLLIAVHALTADSVLVTNDQAFQQMADLSVEDWTV